MFVYTKPPMPRDKYRKVNILGSLLVPAAISIVIFYLLYVFFLSHIWGDQAFLLYAAKEVLAGVKLDGPRLIEVNPPLIVWFSDDTNRCRTGSSYFTYRCVAGDHSIFCVGEYCLECEAASNRGNWRSPRGAGLTAGCISGRGRTDYPARDVRSKGTVHVGSSNALRVGGQYGRR